jgi:hypothetical protein
LLGTEIAESDKSDQMTAGCTELKDDAAFFKLEPVSDPSDQQSPMQEIPAHWDMLLQLAQDYARNDPLINLEEDLRPITIESKISFKDTRTSVERNTNAVEITEQCSATNAMSHPLNYQTSTSAGNESALLHSSSDGDLSKANIPFHPGCQPQINHIESSGCTDEADFGFLPPKRSKPLSEYIDRLPMFKRAYPNHHSDNPLTTPNCFVEAREALSVPVDNHRSFTEEVLTILKNVPKPIQPCNMVFQNDDWILATRQTDLSPPSNPVEWVVLKNRNESSQTRPVNSDEDEDWDTSWMKLEQYWAFELEDVPVGLGL